LRDYQKKLLISLTAVLILIFGAVSVYGASNVSTVVQAYTGVKIVYNGTTLTSESQPYIINNTTYVPIRMLMNQFGKDISWDGTNQQVIIKDSATEVSKDQQITELKNQITTLNAKIGGLETALGNADTTIRSIDEALSKYSKTADVGLTNDTSINDIKLTLNDYFDSAGNDYFSDDGIITTISLNGDANDLAYTIKLDFNNANDFANLTDVSQTKLKSLMITAKSKINSEIAGTSYADANLTGKLVDNDNSSYYVKYDGSSYTYSWDNTSSTSISQIKTTLNNYFDTAGNDYFSDDGIITTISLSGDTSDLAYTIKLDFSNANDYSNLTSVSQTKVKSLMIALKSKINTEVAGTNYADAKLTGKLVDNDSSGYYVTYNGSVYTFSY